MRRENRPRRRSPHSLSRDTAKFALHDAQLVLARSHGFESWPKLKAYVDGVTVRRLAEAIRADDLARVRAILRARPEIADLTMSYGDEHRPIHFAVMRRSPEMVRLLMRHGANARHGIDPHRDATSALTIARERGYGEIVAIIEEEERQRAPAKPTAGQDEPSRQALGDEAARAAVAAGDTAWARARAAEGKLVNQIRWDEGGLLTVAVRHDQGEMLRLLLETGFDPDERVSNGEGDWVAYSQGYPLWQAAALGRREMADLLRRHGGVVSADIAAIYRQTDLARQMLADEARGEPVAPELLRHGASGGDPEIVRMALEQIDWPPDDVRWFRCLTEPLSFWHHIPWLYAGNREFGRETYLPCFRLILGRSDPNVMGAFRRTILHEVAAMGAHVTEEEVAAFGTAALDAGARMDVRDEILNSTPLGWACRWGRAQLARRMLERGADPIEPDAELWAAPRAWASKVGHHHVLMVLREYGG